MKFIRKNEEDTVSITSAAPKYNIERLLGRELTDIEYEDFVLERHGFTRNDVKIMPSDWVPPSDRTYRGAWDIENSKEGIKVDMPKAREIQKNELRKLRAPLLAKLDIEYQMADEVGDTAKKASIAQQKKALRDVTDDISISNASTVDELKKAVPLVLKGATKGN